MKIRLRFFKEGDKGPFIIDHLLIVELSYCVVLSYWRVAQKYYCISKVNVFACVIDNYRIEYSQSEFLIINLWLKMKLYKTIFFCIIWLRQTSSTKEVVAFINRRF